jgi:hypothetical protein
VKHHILPQNKKSKTAWRGFAFLLCVVIQSATAQDVRDSSRANNEWDVYLNDHSKIRAKIISREKGQLKIVTQQEDTVTLTEDKLLGVVSAGDQLKKIHQTLFSHRYFISPSSIPAKLGAFYYSNQDLFFNSVHYGFSKRLTAGLTVAPFVQLYTIPKIKYCFNPEGRLKFAINAAYVHVYDYGLWGEGGRQQGFGYMQALVTSGTADNNFTIGVGKAVINTWTNIDYIISFAWQKKLSGEVSFITDNNLLYSQKGSFGYIVSAGFRVNSNYHSFDFSMVTLPREANRNDRIIPIPVISYSLQINKRKK